MRLPKLILPRLIIGAVTLSLPLLALAETTKPIRMRVIESGTGKPVAGAQVRYTAMAREGTWTGHGGQYAAMFDITAESDADGTISIPPKAFSPRIFGLFGLNTNYENATMTITRSGYETLELRNQTRIIPNLDEVIAWEYNGRTVELKPAREGISKPRPVPGQLQVKPAPMPVHPQQPIPVRRADEGLPQHRGAATPR